MKTMDRFVYQELFSHMLGAFYNGEEIDSIREVEYDGQFYENETFMIRDYDWTEDDEVGKNEYHFHHKPSGLKIYWYKYPMRSPKTNFDVTPQQFLTVLYDCRNSLNPNITYNLDKHVWWNKGAIKMANELEQKIKELENYNDELIRDNNQLRTELSEQYSHNLQIEIDYDEKIKSLEYDLFLEKTRDSKNKFYWFTGKTRPPAHVVYSNKETQFFGFSEVPQYKFIEHHDLKFKTCTYLDDLIEQFG